MLNGIAIDLKPFYECLPETMHTQLNSWLDMQSQNNNNNNAKTNEFKLSIFQLSDIQSNKCLPSATFIYKINSIYNILQVAMSAYAINVRNYLDPHIPPKIIELLNSIRQITNVCIERMLFHEDDYIVQVSEWFSDHDIYHF